MSMMKIVLATNNQKKLAEMRKILADILDDATLFSLSDCGIDIEIEENGKTFEENAEIKARAVFELTGQISVADDSGLMVEALGGRPGVYSARYGGAELSDEERVLKLLGELSGEPNRRAKFVSAVCCVLPGGESFTVRGECEGEIAQSPKGYGGFGYDPVFYIPKYGKTFAELSPDIKNTISHRGAALEKFKDKFLEAVSKEK